MLNIIFCMSFVCQVWVSLSLSTIDTLRREYVRFSNVQRNKVKTRRKQLSWDTRLTMYSKYENWRQNHAGEIWRVAIWNDREIKRYVGWTVRIFQHREKKSKPAESNSFNARLVWLCVLNMKIGAKTTLWNLKSRIWPVQSRFVVFFSLFRRGARVSIGSIYIYILYIRRWYLSIRIYVSMYVSIYLLSISHMIDHIYMRNI